MNKEKDVLTIMEELINSFRKNEIIRVSMEIDTGLNAEEKVNYIEIGKESIFSFREEEILKFIKTVANYEVKEYTFYIKYNATKEEIVFKSRIVIGVE